MTERQTYCSDSRCYGPSRHVQGSAGCKFGPMTEHPTDAQKEAGRKAHWASDPEADLTDYLSAIYLAMEAAKPSTPIDDEGFRLLEFAVKAIQTGHSEPLFIARDAIRNYLEDRRLNVS